MLRDSGIYITERMYANSWLTMWYLRLIGLFPLVVERTNLGLVLKWSPWVALGSFLYGALIITFSIYGQVKDIFLNNHHSIFVKSIIDIFPRLFTLTGYCSVAFCGIFIMPSKLNQFFAYIKRIKQVDWIIATKYTQFEKYSPVLTLLVLFMSDNVVIFLDIWMAYKGVGGEIGLTGIFTRSGGLFIVAQMTYAIEYTNCHLVRSLEKRFVRLNELLEQLHLKARKMGRVERDSKPVKSKTNPRRSFYGCNKKPAHLNLALVQLRDAYLKLMDAQHILNDFLGLNSLVIAIASVSIILIANPYFLIMILSGKRGGTTELIERVGNFCMQITRVILITEPWYACTLRAESTKAHVCKLLSLNSDRRFRKQVDCFWIVICLRQLNIAPLGFFKINRFLITTLIQNITTFVVILLQAHG